MEDGSTKEEWKMTVETKKILDPDIKVIADLRARAGLHRPCRGGACRVRERRSRSAEARAALREAPGVAVVDHRADDGYVTPVEVAGEDDVYVSRIREDPTVENGLALLGGRPTTCARARR